MFARRGSSLLSKGAAGILLFATKVMADGNNESRGISPAVWIVPIGFLMCCCAATLNHRLRRGAAVPADLPYNNFDDINPPIIESRFI